MSTESKFTNINTEAESEAGRDKEPALGLRTSDYYFDLPEELIAQDPSAVRDMARLLVMDRESGSLEHRIFNSRQAPWHQRGYRGPRGGLSSEKKGSGRVGDPGKAG